jgi:sugar lactone lactonase YvrE
MKQKIIASISILALLSVVGLLVKDFFYDTEKSNQNPYDYNLEKLRNIDLSQVGYIQINELRLDIEYPKAISIDLSDNIYVAGNGKVLIYNKSLEQIKAITIDYNFETLAIGENGMYLGLKNHIVVFDKEGVEVQKWKPINEKSHITSIALSEKYVYVADAGNRMVYQYNFNGEVVREIGAKDAERGIPGFIIPSPYFDMLIGSYGELWVVNPGRHSLEKYNENGDMVSSWARTSMGLDGFSGCCNPSHIAMLSDGSFVTSEKGIERVKVHSPTGDFKTVVATPSSFTEGTRGIDLAVDSEDRIFVLDPAKRVVRIFKVKN